MVLVYPSKPFCGMSSVEEALALGTTWPSEAWSNPRKVKAFGMRAGHDICLTGLPHAMKIHQCSQA